MHSFLSRANAILAYTLTVLAFLTFVCFISTLFIDYRTTAKIEAVKVVVKNVPDYSASREKNDLGYLTFNLKTEIFLVCSRLPTRTLNSACKRNLMKQPSLQPSTRVNALAHYIALLHSHCRQTFIRPVCLFQAKNEVGNYLCYYHDNPVLLPEIRKLAALCENQVVLWDKIIQRGEIAVLDFKNMNTKYYFWDDGNGLKGNPNVTLTLSWNIIPNAGLLPSIFAIGHHAFQFPNDYTKTPV